jgi:hypothetical protein
MGDTLQTLPQAVQDHLRGIVSTTGLPNNDESLELLASGWIEKRSIFETRVAEMGMTEVEDFAADEDRGALLLTYSGSLLTVGPLVDGSRAVDYTSIGVRNDVPENAKADSTTLEEDVVIDEPASFSNGPVRSSSAIYAIAVTTEELDPEEEEDLLAEVAKTLTQEFIEVNKTIVQT